jgi:site-specific DNA-methyltransferase (adenine-specific)
MANSPLKNIQPEQQHNSDMKAIVNPSSPTIANTLVVGSTVILGDCVQLMKGYDDNYFDLAIVDPPYGIGGFTQSETKKYGDYQWNETPPNEEYFKELKRVSKNRIIWGANYYNCFEGGNAAIIWNKQNPHPSLSVCEIASVSWGKRISYFEYQWHGLAMHRIRSGFHPCEKPVALYKWILKNYAKEGMKILDTHVGSGSSQIACDELGFDYTGFEIDKTYFDFSYTLIYAIK